MCECIFVHIYTSHIIIAACKLIQAPHNYAEHRDACSDDLKMFPDESVYICLMVECSSRRVNRARCSCIIIMEERVQHDQFTRDRSAECCTL